MERVDIIKKGCIGTCWHGKYHYLEPWVGCENSCLYCYAQFRSEVHTELKRFNTVFSKPFLLGKHDFQDVKYLLQDQNVNTLKLSRFTDIFSSSFVKNKQAYNLLKVLCESEVKRIIITTKGIPDEDILALITEYKEKFSYNAAVRPVYSAALEPGTMPNEDRIAAAARLNRAGVKTTIHLDPLIVGIDDIENSERLFLRLQAAGLYRLMFSFLLLNDGIIHRFKEGLDAPVLERVLAAYDLEVDRQYLPNQEETTYYSLNNAILTGFVRQLTDLLTKMDFKHVICSLKNKDNPDIAKLDNCNFCNGAFYA